MVRTLIIITLLILTVAVFTISPAASSGFAIAGQPGMHQENGQAKCWGTVVYPGSQITFSFDESQVPDIPLMQGMVIKVLFTSPNGNWKEARVGIQGGRPIPVEVKGSKGDILACEVPIEKLGAIAPGIYGFCPVIGQRASHERITLLIIPVGKHSIYNEDVCILRINFIRPLIAPDAFPAIPAIGPFPAISNYDAWLLYHCDARASTGTVSQDQVRHLVTALINQHIAAGGPVRMAQATEEPATTQPKPESKPAPAQEEPVAKAKTFDPQPTFWVAGRKVNPEVRVQTGGTLDITFKGGQAYRCTLSAPGYESRSWSQESDGIIFRARYPAGTNLLLSVRAYRDGVWGEARTLRIEVTK